MADPLLPSDAAAAADEKEEVYSVWALPPEGPVRDRLKALMSALRSEFGGPRFDPHITVVGAVRLTPSEALRLFRCCCCEGGPGVRGPYTAKVSAVARGGFFYQCVYLLIDPTPEVLKVSEHCSAHFGYKSSTPYMPHLSLLYGDLSDEEKEKVRAKVTTLDASILDLSFTIPELALYKTDTEDKTLESWKKVAVCTLRHDD